MAGKVLAPSQKQRLSGAYLKEYQAFRLGQE